MVIPQSRRGHRVEGMTDLLGGSDSLTPLLRVRRIHHLSSLLLPLPSLDEVFITQIRELDVTIDFSKDLQA